jgi:hypothetical protein
MNTGQRHLTSAGRDRAAAVKFVAMEPPVAVQQLALPEGGLRGSIPRLSKALARKQPSYSI